MYQRKWISQRQCRMERGIYRRMLIVWFWVQGLDLLSLRCYQSPRVDRRSDRESWEMLVSPPLGCLAGHSMGQVLDLRWEYAASDLTWAKLQLIGTGPSGPIYGENKCPQLTQARREEVAFPLSVTQESQVQISTGPGSPVIFKLSK